MGLMDVEVIDKRRRCTSQPLLFQGCIEPPKVASFPDSPSRLNFTWRVNYMWIGEVDTLLPVYNEIHGAVAIYSSPKFRTDDHVPTNYICAVACPLVAFGGSICPLLFTRHLLTFKEVSYDLLIIIVFEILIG